MKTVFECEIPLKEVGVRLLHLAKVTTEEERNRLFLHAKTLGYTANFYKSVTELIEGTVLGHWNASGVRQQSVTNFVFAKEVHLHDEVSNHIYILSQQYTNTVIVFRCKKKSVFRTTF